MSRLEHRLLDKLGREWEGATPGLCIQAFFRGRKIVDVEIGQTYRFYDWASLTKIVFTTTALMHLHDIGAFRVNDPVSRWISWFPERHPARLRDLLTHSAGMTWWYPFFKNLAPKTREVASANEAWQIFQLLLRRRVLLDIEKNGIPKGKIKSVYSDLDFLLLGLALEEIAGADLETVWADLRELVGFEDANFHPLNRPLYSRQSYAPTEVDAWRGQTIQGEVHDENTWALRGVAPHAGLFGSISDLSRWGILLRGGMIGRDSAVFPSAETVKLFTRRAIPVACGDWALGFMMPTKGSASCGPLFSAHSVGHTGFVGTSLWFDPKRDLLVTILSNRVYPTRENRLFQALRPKIHTWIAEVLA